MAARRRALARLLACAGVGLGALPSAPGPTYTAPGDANPLPKTGSPLALALAEVPLLDGSTFRPDQAKGQVLVVYWWASWCPFCAVQSPLMDKLWREPRGRGLKRLALSIDRKPEDVEAIADFV